MTRESYIGMGVALAIFLLTLPLIINNGLSPLYVLNSSLDKFNNYTGVTLSYYSAIFGGLVGGVFTYAGVKLSLDNQDKLIEREVEAHKVLLYTQLNYSYEGIATLDDIKGNSIAFPSLIFYQDWYTHLPYIECLDQQDIKIIADWFSQLQSLEDHVEYSKNGEINIDFIKEQTAAKPYIKKIIEKIKPDDH